jgi:H+/Cl- antiporter ClcA
VPPVSIRTLVIAGVLGAPVALVAVGFTSLLHGAESLLWDELPDAAGWDEPPWWYVLAIPTLAGAIVAAALRLPGGGGHPPLDGLGLQPPHPLHMPGILLAAFATLAGGLVLGPEAPLVALGLVLGAMAARLLRAPEAEGQALVVAGVFAAMATIFAGPLPTLLLLFELVVAGGAVTVQGVIPLLLPGFVASGTGALVFTGIRDWPGVREASLQVFHLPAYETVQILDLGWAIATAAAAAAAVTVARDLAKLIAGRVEARRSLALVGGGLAVGLLAVVFHEVASRPAELVLFSGQSSLPSVTAETAGGVLVALVVAKGLAYAISLGVGFRGGPVFPAIAIGVMAGVLASIALPDFPLAPGVVAGLAGGAAASLKLPFFGALLAALLVGLTATGTAPIAVIAGVTGWLVALRLDLPADPRTSPQSA